MQYVAIDIETTGLDPIQDQILSFGAVIDDLALPDSAERPTFQRFISWDRISGHPFAIARNALILTAILEKTVDGIIEISDLAEHFAYWISSHGLDKFSVAGKNFGTFDEQFLKNVPGWGDRLGGQKGLVHYHRRIIDPAIFFWIPYMDRVLPDMQTCCVRAGLPDIVTHTALDDAITITRLVRAGIRRCGIQRVKPCEKCGHETCVCGTRGM